MGTARELRLTPEIKTKLTQFGDCNIASAAPLLLLTVEQAREINKCCQYSPP